MNFNINKNFSDAFLNSIEKEKLILADDKNRINDVRERKEQQLEDIEDFTNLHGYKFELDVWEFFLSLKPIYINDISRQFKLDLSNYNKDPKALAYQNTKQTDVIAIFERHVFIIECKSTEKLNAKIDKLKPDFLELKHIAEFKEKRVKDLFGDIFIPINMIFTNGYPAPSEKNSEGLNLIKNLSTLKKSPITYYCDHYMEDIKTVLDESESAEFAYKQFLGGFRMMEPDFAPRDNEGKPLKSNVRAFTSSFNPNEAVKKSTAKKRVFTFSISPERMLNISTVAHRRSSKRHVIYNSENEKYYQRLLKKGRVHKISEFLKEKNQSFPNNILVSYRGEKKDLQFKEDDIINEDTIGNIPGTLSFYECPGTFHVIDGQHRLFGYTGINKGEGPRENHRLIVTVFNGLSIAEEAELFLEINNEAKAVHPSLIMEIEWSGRSKTKKNFANGIVFSLRDKKDSCLNNFILQAEESRNLLSPKNFQSNILRMKILEKEVFKNVRFDNNDSNWGTMEKSVANVYEHINTLLKELKVKIPDLWNTSKSTKTQNPGILRDIIVGALMVIIDRATMHIWNKNEPIKLNKLTKLTTPIIQELASGFKKSSNEELYGERGCLNLDFYQIKGSQASNLVAMYLIDLFLKKEYPNLVYDSDEEKVSGLRQGQTPKETLRLINYKNRIGGLLRNRAEKLPIKNKSRTQRGKAHHNVIKLIIERVFMEEDHYGSDPWSVLVMPGFFKEPQKGDDEHHESFNFWKYHQAHQKSLQKHGLRTYQSPFENIEGRSLFKLISEPAKHKRCQPIDKKEERIKAVTDYIWKNLMIFTDEEEKEFDIDKNRKPEFADKLWKKGAEYINLFYLFRGSPGGSIEDAHYKKLTQELENLHEKFDEYETKFIKIVKSITKDIEFDDSSRTEIDEFYGLSDED